MMDDKRPVLQHLSNGQCVGQKVGPVLVSVGLTQPGQGEGEAGGDQEHRVHHRQPDHQSEAEWITYHKSGADEISQ